MFSFPEHTNNLIDYFVRRFKNIVPRDHEESDGVVIWLREKSGFTRPVPLNIVPSTISLSSRSEFSFRGGVAASRISFIILYSPERISIRFIQLILRLRGFLRPSVSVPPSFQPSPSSPSQLSSLFLSYTFFSVDTNKRISVFHSFSTEFRLVVEWAASLRDSFCEDFTRVRR